MGHPLSESPRNKGRVYSNGMLGSTDGTLSLSVMRILMVHVTIDTHLFCLVLHMVRRPLC